jgi:hypothetical protein
VLQLRILPPVQLIVLKLQTVPPVLLVLQLQSVRPFLLVLLPLLSLLVPGKPKTPPRNVPPPKLFSPASPRGS